MSTMIVKVVLIVIIVCVVITYAIMRSETLRTGPVITITSSIPRILEDTQIINLKGNVKNTSFFTINDQRVYPDNNSNFDHSIALPIGYTIIELYATNKHAQETTRLLPIHTLKEQYDNKENNKNNEKER